MASALLSMKGGISAEAPTALAPDEQQERRSALPLLEKAVA